MRAWLLRGGVLAVVHAAAETARADFGVHHPTSRTVFEAIMLGVLVGVAAGWAALDTARGVPGRGMIWLISSLVTGWTAAILAVVAKSVLVDQTGVADLGGALTGGAAFTALVVLLPAGFGLLVGNRIRLPARRGDGAEPDAHDRSDTSG